MSFDLENKLNNDLEFFKVHMTVDINFALHFSSLNIKDVGIITCRNGRIVTEDRALTQYITEKRVSIHTKNILWFIPWKQFKTIHHDIYAEYSWNSDKTEQLTFNVYGKNALDVLKAPIKKWAQDNEFFATFHVKSSTNKYYLNEHFYKFKWNSEYKRKKED